MKKIKPNIVFVLTDDQGYGDLSCHGNQVLKTPNINQHYKNSCRFTNFHVGTTCAPTRSGLLTGHYCNSAGVWHTIGGRSLLRENEWTLANALSESGYRTGHFGKWHLGDSQPFRPHERGFEYSIYHNGGGIGNSGDQWGNDYFDDTYYVNGQPKQFTGYCTDVFFREGMKFIENHKDEQFFCYIAPNAPHGPLNVEQKYIDMYSDSTPHEDRARFYGMITNIDDNFGLLMQKLKELQLTENTIVIFMTDNGTATGAELDDSEFPIESHGSFNGGMRGKKGSPYEGGHRVPFLLYDPASSSSEGKTITTLTSYIDFMPTILDLCDITPAEEHSFHGRSLLPLMNKQSDKSWAERVIVTDTQRIARPMKWRKSSTMKDNWRLVHGKELYDLSVDPGQTNDVSNENSSLVSQLRSEYDKWWDLVSEQFDRDSEFVLSSEAEPVRLTTHDIRNETSDSVWHQGQVREGKVVNGFWAVNVRTEGMYKIEMRRWPEETGYAVSDGINGDDIEWRKDVIQEKNKSFYSWGIALLISWAHLTIGGKDYYQEITDNAKAAVFNVNLTTGSDKIVASFHDKQERSIAPYYLKIIWAGE